MLTGDPTLRNLLAPIRDILADPSVTEVVINRCHEVGTERAGKWSWRAVDALTFDALDSIAILAAGMTSRDVDSTAPICTSTLPDGERIQICRPPATLPGVISLTIRKPAAFARTADDPDFVPLFSTERSTLSQRAAVDQELIALKR